jgi:hypothetical protein
LFNCSSSSKLYMFNDSNYIKSGNVIKLKNVTKHIMPNITTLNNI